MRVSYLMVLIDDRLQQFPLCFFRNKKVSSEEVVKAFIERCKEVNGILNAIVDQRYDAAVEDAKEVDEFLKTNPDIDELKRSKPYLGVPFTTKESNEAQGMLCIPLNTVFAIPTFLILLSLFCHIVVGIWVASFIHATIKPMWHKIHFLLIFLLEFN